MNPASRLPRSGARFVFFPVIVLKTLGLHGALPRLRRCFSTFILAGVIALILNIRFDC